MDHPLDAQPSLHSMRVPFEGRELYADSLQAGKDAYALCIHGGGSKGSSVYREFRHFLFVHGIGSTALDCLGHERTGGNLEDSSLASREKQILTVVRHQAMTPTILVGASMGAYNAILLAQRLGVRQLILVVPGIYTPRAFNVPFGPEFSAVIRRERSWVESDAWLALGEFTGRLLVVAAECDEVVPAEIPKKIISSACKAESVQLLTIPGAKHNGLLPKILNSAEGVRALETCLRLDTARGQAFA